MSRIKSVLTPIFVAFMLVVGVDYAAFAATGQSLLLGRNNSANTLTTLERTTTGPALKIVTKSGASAPLSVNGKGKVANLNADRLDGLDGATLQSKAWTVTATAENELDQFTLPISVPAGRYLFAYAVPMGGLTDTNAECFLQIEDDTNFAGQVNIPIINGPSMGIAISGSAVLTVPAGKKVNLECASGGPFVMGASNPAQLSAVRLDKVVSLGNVALVPVP